jgi:uncharacterized protein (TIGR03083 family)
MSLPVPDRTVSLAAARDATDRFTSLLRGAAPTRTAIGYWSTAELAAHVSHIYGIYVECLNGRTSPVPDHLQLGRSWDAMVKEDPERNLGALADRLDKAAIAFFEGIEAVGWEDPVPWHGGLTVPSYALPSIIVNETEIHGRDVAVAEKRPWDISPANAVLAIQGLMTVMPGYLNPQAAAGLEATFRLALRGAAPSFFRVADGALEISTAAPGPVDCHISADPVDYLLIGYGRKSQWGPMLRGKVLAWGRKPWLGLRFAKLFYVV